jgi:hypothetical protein
MPHEVVPDVYNLTCLDEQDDKRYRAFLFTDGTPTLFDTDLERTTDVLLDEIDNVGVVPERLVITPGDGD